MNKKSLLAAALGVALASAPAISATLNVGVGGLYKFEVAKADANGEEIPGTRRVALDWFHNLIVNSGMDLLGTVLPVQGAIVAARVGTGSTPPSVTDTNLASPLAASNTVNANVSGAAGTAPYYGWYRRTFRFNAGVATGNISEVGIATATTGGTLFSRALTVDGAGNPITITVLSDEILDVVYEYRIYPPAADIAWGPLTISGVSYSGTIRPAEVTSTSPFRWVPWTSGTTAYLMGLIADQSDNNTKAFETQTLGPVTGVPAGAAAPVHSAGSNGILTAGSTSPTYVNGTYYRDHDLRIDLNYANFATGIGSMYISTTMGRWQFNFTPKVPKTASHRFTIGLRLSWTRHVF